MSHNKGFIKFSGSLSELSTLIRNHDGLTVLDIDAVWCPCCRRVMKLLPGYAQEHPNVQLIRVDGEDNAEIKMYYGVEAYPSFKFLKSKSLLEPIDSLTGMDMPLMKKKLATHSY